MIRRAILISDNGGVEDNISATKEDVKNYIDFLMSNIGGAWTNSEIETHRNPNYNIINDLRNYEYDYTITMVSSHGGVKKENGKLYDYGSSLCNEIVLDRTKTSYRGAVLLSNGCDILFDEYLLLKENNIPFKCINKALYRLKKEMSPYSNTDYEKYLSSLKSLEARILTGLIPLDKLNAYYNEVIIPMQYDDIVVSDFKKVITKYTEIKGI